jgi:redox-sensitive bicupin YhaK (pirin superfamily)
MNENPVIEVKELGFQWETDNPFLFCVHHKDAYPKGNGKLGPAASLDGRRLGYDFTLKDGWRMYHGKEIPGFPRHPHRGFETVTIVLEGLVDHADSLGAAGRYGHGDVQWMTAGGGIQHCEMFPLVNENLENPLELFQIWLNLPARDKFVKPYYKMLWNEDIPRITTKDDKGYSAEIMLVAGSIGDIQSPPPNPESWAARPENEVAIWLVKMEAGASWKIPAASATTQRAIYYHRGAGIQVSGRKITSLTSASLNADQEVLLENGDDESHILLLQGRPIDEPVVQYGPFVMNTREEIQQAFDDYNKTEFGGWPWPGNDQTHGPAPRRFARYEDGTEEIRD